MFDQKIIEEHKIPSEFYQSLLNSTFYDNIEIDPYSLELLKKGEKNQRYAVVGWLDEKTKKLYLHFRPSFPETCDAEEEQRKQKFKLSDIVIAPRSATGVVHNAIIKSVSDYAYENKIEFPYINNKSPTIGLSFHIDSGYELCLKKLSLGIDQGRFYIEKTADYLEYTVINPEGKTITDKIHLDEIEGLRQAVSDPLELNSIKPFFQKF